MQALSKELSVHTHSEYENQNAFSNIQVGGKTIKAEGSTDTLALAAGSGITLSPNTTNGQVTITCTAAAIDIATIDEVKEYLGI